MNNRHISFIIYFIVAIDISSILFFLKNLEKFAFVREENKYENYCDFFVQKIRHEQRLCELNLDSSEAILDIKVLKYFSLFDQLSIEQGWVLGCYYVYSWYAGRPVFYVRRINQNNDSLLNIFTKKNIFKYCDSINVFDHIIVDDYQKGLYQLLLFALIGDDFCKFWHSNYSNIDIICSKSTLNEMLLIKDNYYRFDNLTKKEIEKIKYLPTIKESVDSITYRIVIFNAWSGFRETIFTLSKEFPHKINLRKDSILVKYNCGISF